METTATYILLNKSHESSSSKLGKGSQVHQTIPSLGPGSKAGSISPWHKRKVLEKYSVKLSLVFLPLKSLHDTCQLYSCSRIDLWHPRGKIIMSTPSPLQYSKSKSKRRSKGPADSPKALKYGEEIVDKSVSQLVERLTWYV